MHTWLLDQEPDQIFHTQSMVAKRGLTNQANVDPYVKKSFKTQRDRINPAIFAAIGHHFIAKKPPKNADAWV